MLTLFLLLASAAAQAAGPSAPALLAYPFLCPSCDSAQVTTLRYGADGLSLAETHATGEQPMLHPDGDAAAGHPGEWIAGPRTRGQPGRIQRWEGEVGTDFIEVQLDSPIVEGERYAATRRLALASEKPGKKSWSIDGVAVSVVRGEKDRTIAGYPGDHWRASLTWTRTTYDRDGEATDSEDKAVRYELWTTGALPFSPLPYEYEPFKGNHVKPWLAGPVADHLMRELTGELAGHGALLRAEVVGESDATLTLASALPAPPLEADRFAGLPVVASEQVDAFAGPLFMTSLLRDGMLGGPGTATLTIGDRELAGRSAWTLNSAGDLVIALAAREENTTVLLVRPVLGMPEAGRHGTATRPAMTALQAMDEAALEAHARRFQLYGVAAGGMLPTVLTGFDGGEVVLTQAEDGLVAGRVSGHIDTLPTAQPGNRRRVPVVLQFEAPEGLEAFRFRSPEARFY
ncbi:MAG: hypothetical protein ACX93N_06850 [Pseudohaliea sp.]